MSPLTNHYILLENRAVLSIQGQNAYDFLQRLVTNNVNITSHNSGIYALMLTPQGKFLFDFFIVQHHEGFLLDIYKPLQEKILKQFLLYKLRSNVEITLAPQYGVYSIFSNHMDTKYDGINYIINDPRHLQMGKRGFIHDKKLLDARGLETATISHYHLLRYTLTLPEGHSDLTSGESYPHDFSMDQWHAINYQKGCYVGQEVVSRMHHKATPKKSVYTIKSLQGQPLPDANTPVTLPSGESIGYMCSSIYDTGLALLKKEYITKQNLAILVGTVNAVIKG